MIGTDLSTWQDLADRHAAGDTTSHADRLIAEADRAEHAARIARQAANRLAAYGRALPTKYAEANFAQLRGDQNPRGMISSWWERGPRALVIAGPSRTGKTHAAYAITNAVNAAGGWVHATTAAGLSRALKPGGDVLAWNYASTANLLMLDDLGRERVTDWWMEQLQDLVDERCSNERRLIVTCNSDPSAEAAFATLSERYGDPLAERLIDDGGIVVFDGPSVRSLVTSW